MTAVVVVRSIARPSRRSSDLRDPEVEHLDERRAVGAPGQEQVRRLEVAVDDARARAPRRCASQAWRT